MMRQSAPMSGTLIEIDLPAMAYRRKRASGQMSWMLPEMIIFHCIETHLFDTK